MSVVLHAEVQEAGRTAGLLADDERARDRRRYGVCHRPQPTSRHDVQVQGDVAQSARRRGTLQQRRHCPHCR